LGQHAILVSDMMRARIRSDADLAEAANAALGNNAAQMGDQLAPVLPAGALTEFATVWDLHTQAFFNYARGLSTQDESVRTTARADLATYEARLARFFASQSQGRLDPAAAQHAVHMHVDQILAGADAYARKDFAESARMYRAAYSHMFDLGGVLARTLLPRAAAAQLDSPALMLRSSLTELMGEHVALVVAAMRSAVGDRRDLAAMGSALDGNTQDLTGAIDTLFGTPAALQFQTIWADHVDQLMTYTQATVDQDTAGVERSRHALESFERSMATFLSTGTQGRLDAQTLTSAFVGIDRTVLEEIDAYQAKSFRQAHDLAGQLYSTVFTVSGQLAGAIGATLAGRLPRGGSQAGGGGLARSLAGR
jgi:hypothetical protein